MAILLCLPRSPRTSVPGLVGRSCKASSDLALEVLEYHFKHITKASPIPGQRNLMPLLNGRNSKEFNPPQQIT